MKKRRGERWQEWRQREIDAGLEFISRQPQHESRQWEIAVEAWRRRQQADPNTPEGFYWSEQKKREGGE
jgi:hypothetical protein